MFGRPTVFGLAPKHMSPSYSVRDGGEFPDRKKGGNKHYLLNELAKWNKRTSPAAPVLNVLIQQTTGLNSAL